MSKKANSYCAFDILKYVIYLNMYDKKLIFGLTGTKYKHYGISSVMKPCRPRCVYCSINIGSLKRIAVRYTLQHCAHKTRTKVESVYILAVHKITTVCL